eukprot:5197209-Amphidinium_carterae.1
MNGDGMVTTPGSIVQRTWSVLSCTTCASLNQLESSSILWVHSPFKNDRLIDAYSLCVNFLGP